MKCCQPLHASGDFALHSARRSATRTLGGFWIGPAAGLSGSTFGRWAHLAAQLLKLAALASCAGHLLSLGNLNSLQLVVGEEFRCWSTKMDRLVYLDGPHRTVSVRLGDTVSFGVSDEPLTVLGLRGRKR